MLLLQTVPSSVLQLGNENASFSSAKPHFMGKTVWFAEAQVYAKSLQAAEQPWSPL